ncbi:MAG TPA: LysE family translocator [Blastocatellia bacterium]|nr:LysE family translocator [Blastocatellia bacterium]
MSLRLLAIFAVTEFFLSLTPGPAVLLVVSQSISNGFKSSVRGAMGILTGNAIYFALSAVGLGALLSASATLFQAIKWVGAAYLIFIGFRMLLAGNHGETARQGVAAPKRSVRLFSEGVFTQLANPKAIIFFSSLLPQFVTPGGKVFEQFATLGIISLAVEFPVLLIYGWAASGGSRLVLKGRFSALPGRVAGGFLIGAGVSLAAVRKI